MLKRIFEENGKLKQEIGCRIEFSFFGSVSGFFFFATSLTNFTLWRAEMDNLFLLTLYACVKYSQSN